LSTASELGWFNGNHVHKVSTGPTALLFPSRDISRPVEISWKGKQSWLDRRSTVSHWDQQEKTLQGPKLTFLCERQMATEIFFPVARWKILVAKKCP